MSSLGSWGGGGGGSGGGESAMTGNSHSGPGLEQTFSMIIDQSEGNRAPSKKMADWDVDSKTGPTRETGQCLHQNKDGGGAFDPHFLVPIFFYVLLFPELLLLCVGEMKEGGG